MATLVSANGFEEVPDEMAGKALQSKAFKLPDSPLHFGQDGQVRLIDPNGQAVVVPPEQAVQALNSGFRLRNQGDEVQGFSSSVGAFATGLAKTALPFGVGENILKTAGVPVEAYEKYRSGSVLTGEIGAMIAATLATEGAAAPAAMNALSKALAVPRLFNKIGTATTKGVEGALLNLASKESSPLLLKAIAKTAGMVAGGGTEGALWGLSYAVGEAALGEPEIAAEGLLAGIGSSAFAGAVFGGVLGGLSAMFGRGIQDVERRAATKLEEIANRPGTKEAAIVRADKSMSKAMGLAVKDLEKMGPERFKESAAFILDDTVLPDGAVMKKGMGASEIYKRAKVARDSIGSKIGALDDQLDTAAKEFGEDPLFNMYQVANKVKAKLAKIDTPIESEARKVLNDFVEKYGESPNMTMQDAKTIWIKYGQAHEKMGNTFANDAKKFISDVMREEHLTAAKMFSDLTGKASELFTPLLQANAQYSAVSNIIKPLKKAHLANAKANDAEQLFNLTASRFGGRLQWMAANAITNPTNAAGTIAGAVVGGVPGAIAGAAATMFVRGLAPEASTVAIVARKVAYNNAAVEKLVQIRMRVDKAVDGFMDSLFTGRTSRSVVVQQLANKETKDSRLEAKKLIGELRKMQADPNLLADRISAATLGLADIDPKLNGHLQTKLQVQFATLMKESEGILPPTDPLQPYIDDETNLPSHNKAASFVRKSQALIDPVGVMERAANGQATTAEIQAMTSAFPKLSLAFGEAIMERIASEHRRISPTARQQLSAWFGADMGGSTSGGYLRRAQMAYKRVQGNEPAIGGYGPGNPNPSATANAKNLVASQRSGTAAIDAGLQKA